MEVYPHWWCMVCKNPDDLEELYIITNETENYLGAIKDVIHKVCLVGFNIKGYDLRILNAIQRKLSPEEVYEVSNAIVNNIEWVYNDYSFWNNYIFTDLYDDWSGSLKEFESNVGMSVEETDVPFGKENLTKEDIESIIKYCIHDVDATCKLYEFRKEYIQSKTMLSELFDIPYITTLRSTNAKLCALALKAKQLNRLQSRDFEIPKNVEPYIKKHLPKEVIDLFKSFNNEYEDKTVNLFGNTVVFGIGGIHSTISDRIIAKATDDYSLINVDVTLVIWRN